ncbi:MAG: ERF family protein, partial [Alphaproteobacteria bacterium]
MSEQRSEQSSTETNELATALAKARPEMPHPIKNCRNPHFDNTYADQKAIMDAISPAMGKHGLSLTFQPDGEALTMHGYLRHSSGQWLRASLPLILGNRRDMQALGAAITYAKRYLTGALLSLHHDTDDDAESV